MKKRTVLRPCLWLLLILCLLISTAVSAQDSVNPEIELDSHQFKPGQRIYFGNFDFDTVFPESFYDAYRNSNKTEGPISWIIKNAPAEDYYFDLYSENSLFTMYIHYNRYLTIADYSSFNLYQSDLYQTILPAFKEKAFSSLEKNILSGNVYLPVNVGPGKEYPINKDPGAYPSDPAYWAVWSVGTDGAERLGRSSQPLGDYFIRPAMNMYTGNILFSSSAESGKTDTEIGLNALQRIGTTDSSDRKLTIYDYDRHGFIAEADKESVLSGDVINITYSGAKTGDREYISVLLVTEDGDVMYYGNLDKNSAEGTQALRIPEDVPAGMYSLMIFNEQKNGDYRTDYSSRFIDIPLFVNQTYDDGHPEITTGQELYEHAAKYWMGYFNAELAPEYLELNRNYNPRYHSAPIVWIIKNLEEGLVKAFSEYTLVWSRYHDNHVVAETKDLTAATSEMYQKTLPFIRTSSFTSPEDRAIASFRLPENEGASPTHDYYLIDGEIEKCTFDEQSWCTTETNGENYHYGTLDEGYYASWGIRPTMQLDPEKILLTSFADKHAKEVTHGTLKKIQKFSAVHTLKMTFLDESRDFEASIASDRVLAGGMVQAEYSNALTGDNEFISVLICDQEGKALYYGSYPAESTEGTLSITIPADIPNGEYRVMLYNEQKNDIHYSDYGSAFQESALTIGPEEDEGLRLFRLSGFTTELPKTGLKGLNITGLKASVDYKPLALSLQIPSLNVESDIVAVEQTGGEYPVLELGSNAGLLADSDLPGTGHTVIAAHNTLSSTEYGPFALLPAMEEGDLFFIRDKRGDLMSFRVFDSRKIGATDFDTLYQVAESSDITVTLLTCEDELPEGGYASRRIVTGKLMK